MERRPSLSLDDRNKALGMLEVGVNAADVARRKGVHERTIYRLHSRFRQTGNVRDRPRSGRPLKTTPRADRYLVTSSRRHRFLVAKKLASRLRDATRTRICNESVRNRL